MGPSITLKDPRGYLVTSGKIYLSHGAIYEIKNPRPGRWRLTVSQAGKHSYQVKGSSKTNVDFEYFFVMIPTRGRNKKPIPISHPLLGKCIQKFVHPIHDPRTRSLRFDTHTNYLSSQRYASELRFEAKRFQKWGRRRGPTGCNVIGLKADLGECHLQIVCPPPPPKLTSFSHITPPQKELLLGWPLPLQNMLHRLFEISQNFARPHTPTPHSPTPHTPHFFFYYFWTGLPQKPCFWRAPFPKSHQPPQSPRPPPPLSHTKWTVPYLRKCNCWVIRLVFDCALFQFR